MSADFNPYRVLGEPSGGTAAGGHMRGYAWGTEAVDEVAMDSLDRYRVTLAGSTDVLIVQPQQNTVWQVPNAAEGRGTDAIDGDGVWMYPETIPDVADGQPLSIHLSFSPMVEAVFWHTTAPVTFAAATVVGQQTDEMNTEPGTRWDIGTEGGPLHTFEFTHEGVRHRRFVSPGAAARPTDRFVGAYDLHEIGLLKIGHPLDLYARSSADGHQLPVGSAVATITNLFDHGPRTLSPGQERSLS